MVSTLLCILSLFEALSETVVSAKSKRSLRRFTELFCQLLKSWYKETTKKTKFSSQETNKIITKYTFPLMQMSTLIINHSTASNDFDGTRSMQFDTDSIECGIDNRCSACISHVRSHFKGPLTATTRVIKGYGGTKTHNIFIGTLSLRLEDDNGKITSFEIPESYYTPDGDACLLSPQHWAKSMKKSQRPPDGYAPEQTFHDRVVLQWGRNHLSTKTIPLDPRTNVATFSLAHGFNEFELYCNQCIDVAKEDLNPVTIEEAAVLEEGENREISLGDPEYNVASPKQASFDLDGPTNQDQPVTIDEEDLQRENISAEFLKLHQKFNHCSPKRLQLLAKIGVIPPKFARCPVPVCSACLYGKATRRPWRTKAPNSPLYTPSKPGEVVSVDQMVSQTPGLIAQMSGLLTRDRYRYCTVFVDHATDYSYVHFQRTASAEETVDGKEAFERKCREMGVSIQHYHADNGIFASNHWKHNCISKHQGLSFSGVGAHHQNGKAENKIRYLQSQARTMLIHANKRWPKAITSNLWPYAVRMANETSNELPSLSLRDNQTPLQAFSRSTVSLNPRFYQPFGCPVYVLAKELQNAGGIYNKWKDRSRIGVYLGSSPMHAQSVALVLNLKTGRVSPQFHVKFDPSFQTVKKSYGEDVDESLWQKEAGFVEEESLSVQKDFTKMRVQPEQPSTVNTIADDKDKQFPTDSDEPISPIQRKLPREVMSLQPDRISGNYMNTEGPSKTRSGKYYKPEMQETRGLISMTSITEPQDIFCLSILSKDISHEDTLYPKELMIMAASNDPDTLYYHEAMKAPDKQEFIKAMLSEVQGQLERGVFELIPRSQVPEGATVLPAVWSMRRKRKQTTGEVYKWKSRLNIGGHKMIEGRDYDETYAPVASWPAIRTLLSLVLINNWHTIQVDYVQAYPQAPADRPTYMELPKGFKVDHGDKQEFLLEIKRNIYGKKQSGRVWYQYLRSKLQSIGFSVSQHDECVFLRGNAMYVLYTDDSILGGPDQLELDQIISDMQEVGLDITTEGGIDDFLGVNIERKPDGTFHLTQPRLINSILEDLRLLEDRTTTKSTPMATSKILSRHPNSPPFDQHFNYQRVIGKLLFLEKSTRPDLAHAVHQCARFAADPKVEHGQAVKWIGRYLKGTQDKGLILNPSGCSLDLYVDADFAGNWDPEIAGIDPSTAQSRHGYVLMFCGMPILWASQLQAIIALSTTEAEYIGLSRAIQDILPSIRLLNELHQMGYPVPCHEPMVHCRVFEDNSGALEIANNPKYRPRTKHINQRFHFFCSLIRDPSQPYDPERPLCIHKIETKDQPADYLTKALAKELHQQHRKFIQGW